MQPAGAIVVVGGTRGPSSGTTNDIAIVRLLVTGAVDTAFGKRTYAIGPSDDTAVAVAIQTDGRIVVLGETSSSPALPNLDFVLLRCRVDGSLDGQFGSGGKVVTDFGGPNDQPHSLLLVGDTQIVSGGYDSSGAGLVARYWQ